jgi:hypothetical protein
MVDEVTQERERWRVLLEPRTVIVEVPPQLQCEVVHQALL